MPALPPLYINSCKFVALTCVKLVIPRTKHIASRIFDFPDPNITSEKRIETTVPQQQLFIINSPFVIEQSKALAKRIQNFSKSDSENINHCYQLLFSRKASPDELKLALLFLQSKIDGAQKSLDKMDRWEMLAQAFLASNEFMYID